MFNCPKCGNEINENAKFCQYCGTRIEKKVEISKEDLPNIDITKSEQDKELDESTSVINDDIQSEASNEQKEKPKRKRKNEKPVEIEKISENISKYSDGKYRWAYELNMFKNPIILFTVWKIFFFISLAMPVFGFFISLGNSSFWDSFWDILKTWLILLAILTALTILGHTLYAAIMGGKYCVVFEMDEKGIMHTQMAKQVKKAQAIAALTVIAGIAGRNPGLVGVGINSSIKTKSYSQFDIVKKVKITKFTKVIKLSETFEHNQVYASKEDMNFVAKYIIEHCTNAKNYNKLMEKYK